MFEVVFESPRLVCRRWVADDLEAIYAVYSDQDAMRFVGDGQPITWADAERWLKVTEDNYTQRGYGMFTLVERDSGQVVGFAGLVHPSGQLEAEVKYALLRSRWGKGLATEAVLHLLRYAEELGLTRVIGTVAPDHRASQRVLEKAGMKVTQNLPSRFSQDEDALVYEWVA